MALLARRRQNGEGTIYQRPNGLWVCEVTIGYDENRKRLKKTVSSMDLEKLKKKINDIKYLNDRSLVSEPSRYTVGQWIDLWLKHYKEHSVKPTTYDMYYNICQNHIKPHLGHYKLDKLNQLAVQKFINDISGTAYQKGLSLSTIKKIVITLTQAYNKAIELGMLYKNPCSGINLPNKEPKESVAFSAEEQSAFLANCKGESTFENLFIFAFNTGMRMGEMLALTWEDIDFKNKTVTVNKNLSIVKDHNENSERKTKTVIIPSTKNKTIREIPLTRKALAAVQFQKDNNVKESPFVFYSTTGTPIQKRNIYRAFHNIIKTADIKSPVTFHSMRHSFATRLLEKGADIKTISNLLGHKSIQITLDIYSHVQSNLKQKTIELLED